MNYGKRKSLPSVASMDSFGGSECSTEKDIVKRISRNASEKKRRDQFNMLVNELCSMVSTTNRKMDKTTVLQTTISFLRTQNEISEQSHAHEIKEDWKPTFLTNDEFTQLMLEALDGFLLVVTQTGNILYASESVTSLLSHLPSDLVNRSLYEYTHPDERMKIYNLLSSHKVLDSNTEELEYTIEENQLSFTCHLRCGSTDPRDVPIYELVKCTGNFRKWNKDWGCLTENSNSSFDLSAAEVCFCCTVRLQDLQLIREMPLIDEAKKEFTSRHSLEWKFLFLDQRGPSVIGYLPFEVLGTSGYDYYHPDDLESLAVCHEQLMQTGEGMSCHYRFLTKGQQWLWLQTRYYITYHQWNSKPEFIVCTNTVVSYSDVRAHRRRQLGLVEKDILAAEMSVTDNIQETLSPASDQIGSSSHWGMMGGTSKTASMISDLQSTHASESDAADTTEQMSVGLPQSTPPLQPVAPQPPAMGATAAIQPQAAIPPTAAPQSLAAMGTQQVTGILPQQPPLLVSLGQQFTMQPTLAQVITSTMPVQPLVMTPVQQRLQEQLQQKHQQLQQAILRQQEELRLISEQLLLTQQMALPISQPQMVPQMLVDQRTSVPILSTTSIAALGNISHGVCNTQVTNATLGPVDVGDGEGNKKRQFVPMTMMGAQPVIPFPHAGIIMSPAPAQVPPTPQTPNPAVPSTSSQQAPPGH